MITSEIISVLTVFNNDDIYEIPDFQRDFVWGKKEVKQLFSDFYEDTDTLNKEINDLDGYLLGNIVLINDQFSKKRKIVIDGQQRLTTLSLVYKCLEDILEERIKLSNDTDRILTKMSNDLSKGYGLFNDDYEFIERKIQHHESLKFGDAYRKLISNQIVNLDAIESSSDSQIYEVYQSIHEHLCDLNETQIRKFVSYIKNKVLLIVTTAPSLSKAFQLFEILNNRGKDLEPLDLIKNTLLKHIESSDNSRTIREDFNKDWHQFMENLELDKKKKIESSTFLKHYFMGTKGVNIKKENLFDYFTDEKTVPFKNVNEIRNLVNDFKKVSKIYGSIERKQYETFSKDITSMKILFQLLGLKQMHVLLIPFYFEEESKKSIVLDLAIRLGASVIFSFTPANFIEKELPNKINKYQLDRINIGTEKAFQNFVNSLEQLINQQALLVNEAVSNRKFENAKGHYIPKGKDLFKFLEAFAHNKTDIVNNPSSKNYSLEHILPRNAGLYEPTLAGFKNAIEMTEYMNRIGNLALIKTSDNSHLGKKIFSQKKDVYAKSEFFSTKVIGKPVSTHIKVGEERILVEQVNDNFSSISEADYWTKSMIIQRSKEIGSYLEKILTKQI